MVPAERFNKYMVILKIRPFKKPRLSHIEYLLSENYDILIYNFWCYGRDSNPRCGMVVYKTTAVAAEPP